MSLCREGGRNGPEKKLDHLGHLRKWVIANALKEPLQTHPKYFTEPCREVVGTLEDVNRCLRPNEPLPSLPSASQKPTGAESASIPARNAGHTVALWPRPGVTWGFWAIFGLLEGW